MINNPKIVCQECGKKVPKDFSYEVEGEYYCEVCFDKKYVYCEQCDTVVEQENAYFIHDAWYCEDCKYEYWDICEGCGEYVWRSDAYYSDITGNAYCDDCYHDLFCVCQNCGAEMYIEDAHEGRYGYYCDECFEDTGCIHNYSYDPYWTYHRLKQERYNERPRLYFGVELEIENKKGRENNRSIAKELSDAHKGNLFYCKYDNSLNNGFEIVTHPFTWLWWQKNKKEFDIVFKLRKRGFRSHNTRTCGMHIHLTKKCFKTLYLYKFQEFFYKPENYYFILSISQRTRSKLDEWAYTSISKKGQKETAKYKDQSYDRHCAVNCKRRDTVEVRIFRGNLLPHRFAKNLEFVKAVYDFTGCNSMKDLTIINFIEYVIRNKKDFINLYNYLKETGWLEGNKIVRKRDNEEEN